MRARSDLSIGELSRRTGCNIETIRYYEQIGILPPALRRDNGFRRYDSGDAARLSFIRRARELGFTLDDIRGLLSLASVGDSENACAEARRIAAGHVAAIKTRIADLRAMERVLSEAVRQCDTGETPGCPIIDTLSTLPLR